MRAVRFDRYGDVDVLEVRQVDEPVPGDGQVVVAVRAAAINPGESKIRRGELHERWPARFPEGEGSDFAGVVVRVAPGVRQFKAGDEVLGYTNERGSHAEFVVAAQDEIVAKPPALDWAVAGSVFVVGTSAYALNQAAAVGANDVVVVSGAAGGVGSLTAQWARSVVGATVIGVAGPDRHAWLAAHGILPVDYHGAGLADRVRTAADGAAVSAVLDTVGSAYIELGLELGVAPSRIATVADFSAGQRGATVVQHFTAATPEVLSQLAELLASGRLELRVASTYPLDRVRDAYRELDSGHPRGKIVLVP